MRRFGLLAALAGGAALATLTLSSEAQAPAAPKARYFLDATTASGILGNPMAALFGRGGNSEEHQLQLRLGSTLSPTGGPAKADHFMPAGMRLGMSVPLATPTPGVAKPDQGRGRPPAARIPPAQGAAADLLGLRRACRRRAAGGARLLEAGGGSGAAEPVHRQRAGRARAELWPSRTYRRMAEPLDRKPTKLDRASSLVGDHRIAGNYSPEISFTLQRDFMAGLHAQSAGAGDGSTMLSWNPITQRHRLLRLGDGRQSRWARTAPTWCGGRPPAARNSVPACGTGSPPRRSTGWSRSGW